MNRVAKIVIYALALFLIYLWINSIAKSCNKTEINDTYSEAEAAEEGDYTSDEEIYDEYFEGDEEGASEASTNEEYDVVESTQEEVETNSEEFDDDFSYEQDETETNTVTSSSQSSNAGSSSGRYLIVAGSYLIKENADKMVKKLRGMGYSNSEVVTFDLSQYHTVVAGRFDSRSSAGNTVSKLKSSGIDCYVHTRK